MTRVKHGVAVLLCTTTCCLLQTCNAFRKPLNHFTLRGGSSSDGSKPLTLGDLERNHPSFNDPFEPQQQQQEEGVAKVKKSSSSSLNDSIQSYFFKLNRVSPLLSSGTVSCLSIFLLWHVAPLQHFLESYFVCSRHNIMRNKRYVALWLSALSHSSPTHLLVNMFGWTNFGPSVCKLLKRSGWPFWPLVVGAAAASSVTFLIFSKHNGCMGLSGVTLALLAFYARAYPNHELGFVIGVIPVRLSAKLALLVLFGWSLLGSIAQSKDNVAHSTHLGGLLFGAAYYELWLRRRHFTRIMTRLSRQSSFRTK